MTCLSGDYRTADRQPQTAVWLDRGRGNFMTGTAKEVSAENCFALTKKNNYYILAKKEPSKLAERRRA